MKRRAWMWGAVAAAAGAAGAGLSWRHTQPTGDNGTPLDDNVWSQRFELPDGGELRLDSLRHAPLLLNFWATWCPPCLKEMPLLDAFYRQHQAAGWRVLGLAIDGAAPVREFMAKRPVSFPVALAGLPGSDLGRTLGNAAGSLPFTVVIGRQGQVIDRKLGALDDADLARWAAMGTR